MHKRTNLANPSGHKAIHNRLRSQGLLDRMVPIQSRPATVDEIATIHTNELIAGVLQTSETLAAKAREEGVGGWCIAPQGDTYYTQDTARAALLSAGNVIAAVEKVVRGQCVNAIANVRPPGHHAESNCSMGFCIFNNVAVAAAVALSSYEGVNRVMIVDWDVHHGNATEHQFEDNPNVLYVSLHRYDSGQFYPGTGKPSSTGKGRGAGYNVNIGWNGPGAGDPEYLAAFHNLIMPIGHAFNPDLVLVSAGFDSARGDPLGGCRVSPAGFAHMTAMLKALARGRMVVALEGGYNLRSISRSMEACARVLLGDGPLPSLVPSSGGSKGSVGAPPSMGLWGASNAELQASGSVHHHPGMGRGRPGGGGGVGGSNGMVGMGRGGIWRRPSSSAGRVIMTSARFAPRTKHMQCVAETMMLQSEFWRDVLFPIMTLRKKEADLRTEQKELMDRLENQEAKMRHASMRFEREREREKDRKKEREREREQAWEKERGELIGLAKAAAAVAARATAQPLHGVGGGSSRSRSSYGAGGARPLRSRWLQRRALAYPRGGAVSLRTGDGAISLAGSAGSISTEKHAQLFRSLIVQQLKRQNRFQREQGKRGSPSPGMSRRNKRPKTSKHAPNNVTGRAIVSNSGNKSSASSSLRHIMQGQQRMMRRNDMSLLGSKPRDRRIKIQGVDPSGSSGAAKKKKKTRRRQSAEDFASTFLS